jgi:hypothetical protein
VATPLRGVVEPDVAGAGTWCWCVVWLGLCSCSVWLSLASRMQLRGVVEPDVPGVVARCEVRFGGAGVV